MYRVVLYLLIILIIVNLSMSGLSCPTCILCFLSSMFHKSLGVAISFLTSYLDYMASLLACTVVSLHLPDLIRVLFMSKNRDLL